MLYGCKILSYIQNNKAHFQLNHLEYLNSQECSIKYKMIEKALTMFHRSSDGNTKVVEFCKLIYN